jgi:RNA polymerase sigma-70 factor, ECF subfamily
MIDSARFQRLYRTANAARWPVPAEVFQDALEAGVRRVFAGTVPSRRELDRHLDGLHVQDLALACACAAGNEGAWEYFVAEHRPVLYRAADALDPSGAAREIADSLYAELYGVRGDREGRASLFRYFHGRSSLATWLRAVLAQRHVDRLRADRRLSPLDEEAAEQAAAVPVAQPDPERARIAVLVGRALRVAISRLSAKDRLRLRAYYEQDLTLAQVGRLTGEHEATVSRQIAKTRKALRTDVDRQLRRESQLSDAEIVRSWESVIEDAGPLDLAALFGSGAGGVRLKEVRLKPDTTDDGTRDGTIEGETRKNRAPESF